MAERGGLNYPIRVKDEFSKTTQLFRKEIRESKKELRSFQAAAKGSKSAAKSLAAQAKATRDLARARKELNSARRSTKKPLTDAERASKKELAAVKKVVAIQREQTARQREIQRIRNSIAADERKRAAALRASERAEAKAAKDRDKQRAKELKRGQARDPRLVAEKRVAAELFKQKVILHQIAMLKRTAAAQTARGDLLGGERTLNSAKRLEKSLKGSAKQANNIFFTFRRLVGTLAIFTLARKGVQTFEQLVAEGIKFNDTIAISQLGIAGLVTTLGDVRNEFGLSVSTTEQLNRALGIAREQTQKLRQDSLKTVATFGELLETFQVSVGPGLAAGLNLDEVRQLTVDISQAAAALGVPQNQLAEEVRSLLSGTIQARTTRIATALGITNADIRRLKEAGELFSFLEEKFAGFGEAAEKTARETFTGISTLVKGLLQEVLGSASQSLFQELISLGNELFDNVLSIRDAAGNIKPNPEVVSAFQAIFEALRRAVISAKEFGQNLGFEGLQVVLGALGFTFQVIIGAMEVVVGLFNDAITLVGSIREQLGLSSGEAGETGRFIGKWGTRILIATALLKKFNLEMLKAVKGPAIIVAAFIGVAKAFEFILEAIFGVNLNIRDTISLIATGLLGAWFKVIEVIELAGQVIGNSLGNALDFLITEAKAKARSAKGFIAALFGDEDAAERAKVLNDAEQVLANSRKAAREQEHKVAMEDIKTQSEAKQKAIDDEIAALIGVAAARDAEGPGFDVSFDPEAAAKEAADAAKSFVSTADKPINELADSLVKVTDEIRRAKQEFEQAKASAGVGGFAGSVGATFDKEEIANAERLRKIKTELTKVEESIVRIREASGVTAEREKAINDALLTNVEDRKEALAALNLAEGEGGLVSALRNELMLRNAINKASETSLDLASVRAATRAAAILPSLQEENSLLQAQVASQRAITAAQEGRASARERAVITARGSLISAVTELAVVRERNLLELQSLQTQIRSLPSGERKQALIENLNALKIQKGLEEEILSLQVRQFEESLRLVDLAANGTITEGLKEGLLQFAEQFNSVFQAGLEIARQSVQALTQFISQSIAAAFDPTQDKSIKERFARFMQQIGQIILQQLLQVAIAKGIQELGLATTKAATEAAAAKAKGVIEITTANTVAGIQIAAAQTIASIKAASGGGFHEGGLVPAGFAKGGEVPHYSRQAQGLASGGRPKHIHPSDTVPAWLTPGEFVMRRKAVDAIGLRNLEAMNGGRMNVVGSASAEAAGPSTGMASGGLVSDQLQTAENNASETKTEIVPVVVARDREMDALTAGGRNAWLAFMSENAGDVNSALGR